MHMYRYSILNKKKEGVEAVRSVWSLFQWITVDWPNTVAVDIIKEWIDLNTYLRGRAGRTWLWIKVGGKTEKCQVLLLVYNTKKQVC